MGDLGFEYYFDEDISSTHVEKHAVTELELFEFFSDAFYLERQRPDASWVAIGKLSSGRYLQVVFRKKSSEIRFIITAFDIEDRDLINMLEQYIG